MCAIVRLTSDTTVIFDNVVHQAEGDALPGSAG